MNLFLIFPGFSQALKESFIRVYMPGILFFATAFLLVLTPISKNCPLP